MTGVRPEPYAGPFGRPDARSRAEPGLVLVVDDDELSRTLMRQRLEEEGHRVALAASGPEALAIAGQTAVDVVLLDATMPGMSSDAMLEQLKADPALRDVPVLLLPGLADMTSVVRCIELGAEDYLPMPLDPALLRARIGACLEKKRYADQERSYLAQLEEAEARSETLLNVVIPIGVSLSSERDFDRLLERILLEAKALCNADGGTLYLRTEDNLLQFLIVRNDSLDIALGGTSGKPITFPPLHLYDEATGEPNHANVATYAALSGTSVNIPDAYEAVGFDFSGTRAFDESTSYRSISFLTVPLKKHDDQVSGVLQLINAQDAKAGGVVAFDEHLQQMVETLSLLAAAALDAYLREQHLRAQVQELRIEIDQMKRQREVAEVTETDFFRQLQSRAKALRKAPERTQ